MVARVNSDQRMLLDEFMAFINLPENDDKRFELIGGYLVAMSSPVSNHQRIVSYMVRKIGNYLEGKNCEVIPDLNVYLYREDIGQCENVFRPDILIACDRKKIADRGHEGTPEFIAEVISKSTGRNDYITKCGYYMEYGVKEYWIVDPYANKILVYFNKDENKDGNEDENKGGNKDKNKDENKGDNKDEKIPPVVRQYTFNDKVQVSLFGDLYIDFSEVLELISDK